MIFLLVACGFHSAGATPEFFSDDHNLWMNQARVGVKSQPVFQWVYQDPADFSSLWNKNISLQFAMSSHACSPTTTVLTDTRDDSIPLRGIFFVALSDPCNYAARIKNWRAEANVLLTDDQKQMTWFQFRHDIYAHHQEDPALLFIGLAAYADTITTIQNFREGNQLQLISRVWVSQIDQIPSNLTFYFQPPRTENGAQRAFRMSGTFPSFAMYFGVASGLFVMIFASFKYSQFYTMEQGIAFSLPQIEICVVALLGFLSWFHSSFHPYQVVAVGEDVQKFFAALAWPVSITALMTLGIYFREVATLTTAKTAGSLSRLKIPAIIMTCTVWAFFLIIEIYEAVDPPDLAAAYFANRQGGLLQPAYVISQARGGVYIALLVIDCIVLGFGGVSLFVAMVSNSSGSRKSMVVRIAVLTGILIACHLLFGLPFWISDVISTNQFATLCDSCTLVNERALFGLLWPALHHLAVSVTLLLNFRVQVSKEIEISKSMMSGGTSSTDMSSGSSSDASSGRSSSSSSGADPVIEL